MEEYRNEKEEVKQATEITIFSIPVTLQEIKESIYISTNKTSKTYKERIIKKAFQYHSQGNISEASKYYQHFIDNGFQDHRVFSNYGIILKDLGNLKDAELSLRKAIKLNPDFAEGFSNLGNILKDLGNLKDAELSLRKAIKLNPDFADAHINLATLLIDLGKLKEAENSYKKAIKLNPNFALSYSNLGFILINNEKLKEAEICIRKAIELKPHYANAHRNLGICLYLKGDKESALNSIIKANLLDSKELSIRILLGIFQKENNSILKKLNINLKKTYEIETNLTSKPIMLTMPVEAELIDSLYEMKARKQKKFQTPTYGNASGSDYKLFEESDERINTIKEKLTAITRDSINSDILISESFFTIFRSGGGLISHDHLSQFDKIKGLNIASKKYSLVYYLSVGDQNCDEPGILKLENPTQDILPHDGLIIIFPAERKHSVFYKGKKDRIIIGINFYSI